MIVCIVRFVKILNKKPSIEFLIRQQSRAGDFRLLHHDRQCYYDLLLFSFSTVKRQFTARVVEP